MALQQPKLTQGNKRSLGVMALIPATWSRVALSLRVSVARTSQ